MYSNRRRGPGKHFAYTMDSFTPFEWENADQYEARAIRQLQAERRRVKRRQLQPGYQPKTPSEAAEMSAIWSKLASFNVEIVKNVEALREKETASGCESEPRINANCPCHIEDLGSQKTPNDTLRVGEITQEHTGLHTPKPVHVLRNSAPEKREWRRKFSCKYAESVTSTFYYSRFFSTQARGYGNSVGGDNIAVGGAFGPAPYSVTPQHSYRPRPSPGGITRQVIENIDVQKRGSVDDEKNTSPRVDVISHTCNAVPRARDVREGTSSPIGLGLGAWKTCMPLRPPDATVKLAIADTCPAPAVAIAKGKGLAWDLPASLVAAILAAVELGLRSRQLLTVYVDDDDVERVADLALAVGSDERSSCLRRVYSWMVACLAEPVDAPHIIGAAARWAMEQVSTRKTIWLMFWRGYQKQGEGDSARAELQRVLDEGHVAVVRQG